MARKLGTPPLKLLAFMMPSIVIPSAAGSLAVTAFPTCGTEEKALNDSRAQRHVRRMRPSLLIAAIIGVFAVGGIAFYGLTAPGATPTGGQATTQSTQSQGVTGQGSAANYLYGCAKPAISSQYVCDQIPAGYQIKQRLPNAPQAFCWPQMTQSACALFKQTFANGVCDPNETVFTDPLDCGCTGVVIGDPYTGRCGAPATVCLAAQAVQPQQGA